MICLFLLNLLMIYTLSITADTVYAGMLSISNSSPYPRHIFGPLIGWTEEDGYDYEYEVVDGEIVEKKNENIDYAAINSFWGIDADVSTILSSGPFVFFRICSKSENRS